jgi:hypothetical protein
MGHPSMETQVQVTVKTNSVQVRTQLCPAYRKETNPASAWRCDGLLKITYNAHYVVFQFIESAYNRQ